MPSLPISEPTSTSSPTLKQPFPGREIHAAKTKWLHPPCVSVGEDRAEEQHGDICTHLLQQSKVQTLHQVSVLHVTTQELGLLDQLSPLLRSRFIPVQ